MVKNWKRGMRRTVCALLTAAMLCSDAGVTAYAAEPGKELSTGVSGQTLEETKAPECQPEEAAAGELQEKKTQAEDEQPGENPAEGGDTEEPVAGDTQPGESPVDDSDIEKPSAGDGQPGENQAEAGNTEKPSAGEQQEDDASETETGAAGENPVEKDGVPEEAPDAEDVQGVSAEETVSENATEDTETDVVTAEKSLENTELPHGEYTENNSNTKWGIDAEGKLTVTGTGEFAATESRNKAPWYDYRNEIKSAEIKVSGMTDASYMFYGCENLLILDLSGFDTGAVTNMSAMFSGCSSLVKLDWGDIKTENVTDMSEMFKNCESLMKLDVSAFKTGKVTNMEDMFFRCEKLTELDVSNFDTSEVTSTSGMFQACSSLATLNLGGFKTSNVRDMSRMFDGCGCLTVLDVSSFDTANVSRMWQMFLYCSSLQTLDVSHFNTSSVERMEGMFQGCKSLAELNLSSFDAAKVTSAEHAADMLSGCDGLKEVDTPVNLTVAVGLPSGIWRKPDNSVVTELPQELSGSIKLKKDGDNKEPKLSVYLSKNIYRCGSQIDESEISVGYYDADGKYTSLKIGEYTSNIEELDMSIEGTKTLTVNYQGLTSSVSFEVKENLGGTFKGITWSIDEEGNLKVTGSGELQEGGTPPWRGYEEEIGTAEIAVTGTENVEGLFCFYENLTEVNLENFDTSQVEDMSRMFDGCTSLKTLDLSNFKTERVTRMSGMFRGCSALEEIDLSSFNTSGVTDTYGMDRMFADCYSLKKLDLSSFDTRSVKNMEAMFSSCSGLAELDLSGFDMGAVENAEGMLSGCTGMQKIYAPCGLKKLVELPDEMWGTWYQPNGETIAELPLDLQTSIVLTKDKALTLPKIEVEKEKTGYRYGEAVTVDDITVIYYDADGHIHKLSPDDYTTNVKNIDTAKVGEQPLVVTYRADDGKEYTGEIILHVWAEPIAAPTASPNSGQLAAGDKVTLTCATAGAKIYYTMSEEETKLEEPTQESACYTTPITIDRDIYIRAVAVKDGRRSATASFHYTVAKAEENKVLTPTADPAPGTVEKGTKVTLTCATPGAEIYYMAGKEADMSGAVPKDEAHKYTQPVEITEDTKIKAAAVKGGMKDSDEAVFAYKVKVTPGDPAEPVDPAAPAAPTAEPGPGIVDRGSYIVLKADAGVEIYYTTDGSDPASSSTATRYERKIRVEGNAGSAFVIKAAARKDGVSSKPVTFTYIVSEKKVEGFHVMFADREEFTYTGSAVTPAVIVSYNGEELTEGVDYTLKYANNKNAGKGSDRKAPKIIVTGKGNLSQSMSLTFTIHPKDIGDADVFGDSIVAEKGKTAALALFYNGVKLTAKDFTNPNAGEKYNQDGTITITGKGNFTGKRSIGVRAVDKTDLKKLTVVVDNAALKKNPLVYDGTEKKADGYFQVYDAKDRTKNTPLKENVDYAVIYPRDIISAGKVKFTVVGLDNYCGEVSRAYTIRPRAVKQEADGKMSVNVADGGVYSYKNGGAVIPGLAVTCNGKELVSGKDYKVTYSGNKKVCTDSRAKCKISFIGNYKGSAPITRSFRIDAIDLNDAQTKAHIAIGDVVYTGKPGTYKAAPYVTVNGTLLKASDYKLSYYVDADRQTPLDGKSAAASVDLTSQNRQTVYVKIEGKEKGNYKGVLTTQYDVRKADGAIDLSKAKIQFAAGSKVVYTGEGVEPVIKVMYKDGGEWKTIDADDIGTSAGKPVTVTYINNVNKGKATVMIQGGGKYVGSKTAGFSIVEKGIK